MIQQVQRRNLAVERRRIRGVTLIELLITVVIVAILASIAIPSYTSYVLRSHRVEAKNALLDLASMEERFFSTQNLYSQTATDLGYAAFPANVGGLYYQIGAPVVLPAVAPTALLPAGTPSTFTLTATAINNQVNDANCASFTVTSQGVQTSKNSGGTASTGCW